MKQMLQLTKRDLKIVSFTLLAGLLFGWLFFHGSRNAQVKLTAGIPAQMENISHSEKKTIWTCSMHPQIRMDHPGKCPIYGMDLIPLKEDAGDGVMALT